MKKHTIISTAIFTFSLVISQAESIVSAPEILKALKTKNPKTTTESTPLYRRGFTISSDWIDQTTPQKNTQPSTIKKKKPSVVLDEPSKDDPIKNSIPNAVKVVEAEGNTMFAQIKKVTLKKPKKEKPQEVKSALHQAKPIAVYALSKFSFPIHFKIDSYEILSGYPKKQLHELAKAMKGEPTAVFLLEGHTCDLGEAIYNNWLSAARAISARNFLVSKGVKPSQIICRGYGESEPEFKWNPSFGKSVQEKMRQQNRRVVIRMVKTLKK